jgi:S1-C subfamily serine protease
LRHSAVALPLKTIHRVADELLKEGRIRHGYLGVGLQPVRIPANLRSKVPSAAESGLILLNVEPDSPAEIAKLQVGDILVALNGEAIAGIEDLQTALRGDVVGQNAKVLLIRGGEPVEVPVAVVERAKREK